MEITVIPAKAGIQKRGHVNFAKALDSRLRGNDGEVHCYMLVGFTRLRYTKSTHPAAGLTRHPASRENAGTMDRPSHDRTREKALARYRQRIDRLRDDCPVRAALDVIRGRWKPSLLFELKDGPRRYSELQKGGAQMGIRNARTEGDGGRKVC